MEDKEAENFEKKNVEENTLISGGFTGYNKDDLHYREIYTRIHSYWSKLRTGG